MSNEIARTKEGFTPAYLKLLNDGNAWVDRQNRVSNTRSYCPRWAYPLMVIALAGLIVGKVKFADISSWLVAKTTSGISSMAEPDRSAEVVLQSRISEMLTSAVSDGNKAKLSLSGLSIRHANPEFSPMTLESVTKEIVEGAGDPAYVPFPEIGQPWPADGPILTKKSGEVIWVGVRFSTNRGDVAWLGVIRKNAEKPTLYSVAPAITGIPAVNQNDIPREVIAAGFGENVAGKNTESTGGK